MYSLGLSPNLEAQLSDYSDGKFNYSDRWFLLLSLIWCSESGM